MFFCVFIKKSCLLLLDKGYFGIYIKTKTTIRSVTEYYGRYNNLIERSDKGERANYGTDIGRIFNFGTYVKQKNS